MTEYEHQAVASSIRKYHWEIFSMSFLMYLLYSGNLKRRNVPSPLRLNNNISKTQKKDPSLSEKWKSIEFHVFHYFFFQHFSPPAFSVLATICHPLGENLKFIFFSILYFLHRKSLILYGFPILGQFLTEISNIFSFLYAPDIHFK